MSAVETQAQQTQPDLVAIMPASIRPEKPERNLWREQEMLTVLQIIRENNYLALLKDKTVRSEPVFKNIEKQMHDRGLCKKNFQQIWTKWKFLKSTYMTSRRIHHIPKIIPLEVFESLDELLSAEFRNDGGSVSSHDGADYDDCSGSGMPTNYEMMNASASNGGSNDGGLMVISSVQGGVPYNSNGTRHFSDVNGFNNGARRKFKNGFRSFKNEEDTNGFGMQHPIFGYRLGVVKDEPIDDEYENNNNTEDGYSDLPLEEPSNLQQFPQVKTELASPPHTPPPPEQDDLPPVPVLQLPRPQNIIAPVSIPPIMNGPPIVDPTMPPLHRYLPPPLSMVSQPDLPSHPPPLKQLPLIKIALPPKPQPPPVPIPVKQPSPPIPTTVNSKKIPVLTIRKRKKRLNIPQLSEDTDAPPAPIPSKHSKISEEDNSKEDTCEASRIPFMTYGKAMREMTISLREVQREMIDEFFKQQMDLAKSEHEFQKQQDAMLLGCFEDQTKMLLDGAKRLFTSSLPMNPDVVYINDE